MLKVKVLTDSTCDLPKKTLEELQVGLIPLYINFEGELYLDGENLSPKKMFEMIKEHGVLPKTSCRAPEEFKVFFESYLNDGYDQVVYLGIGSDLSATFNNARLASLELGEDKVRVVDSKNLSSGIGLLVYKACKFRDQGMNAFEIGNELEKLVPKVRSQFVIDTLEYLHKGGRCSGMTRVIGTLLRIKPNIKVIEGKLEVARKPRGMKHGLKAMLGDLEEDLNNNNVDLDNIMVTHSYAYDEAEYLKNKMSKMGLDKEVVETTAGCVISTHCGEGTIGILYIVKE